MGCKQLDAKNEGHCYWPLLFLNNNNPGFLHPAFCNLYFGPFFHGHKPIPTIVGADYQTKESTESLTEFGIPSMNFFKLEKSDDIFIFNSKMFISVQDMIHNIVHEIQFL